MIDLKGFYNFPVIGCLITQQYVNLTFKPGPNQMIRVQLKLTCQKVTSELFCTLFASVAQKGLLAVGGVGRIEKRDSLIVRSLASVEINCPQVCSLMF